MTDAQLKITVALIALAGAAAGVVLGIYRHRHQVRSDKYGAFDRERQAAYSDLWAQVEGLNVDNRVEAMSDQEFADRRQGLNAHMLKASIYIDDGDRDLVNRYVDAVRLFHSTVRRSNDLDAVTALGETSEIPPEVLVVAREVADAQEAALDLRAEVIGRVQEIVAGRPVTVG